MTDEPLYRVHGKSTITGYTWQGAGKFPREHAQMIADSNKARNDSDGMSYLEFWIEPAENDDQENAG